MKITRYLLSTESVPVDFRGDPDGEWDYEALVEAAGFLRDQLAIRVGALAAPFRGHPEGAAVVAELEGERMVGRYYAVVEGLTARLAPALVPVLPWHAPELVSPFAADAPHAAPRAA